MSPFNTPLLLLHVTHLSVKVQTLVHNSSY